MLQKQLVAAINFGTTYSGYAYSYTHEWTKVITAIQHGGEYLTYKAPSTLLLNPDQTFCKFGFDAEKEYYRLGEDDEHRDYFFFRRFLSSVKKQFTERKAQRMHRGTVCVDETGKEVDALTIFIHCIKYFIHSLIADLNKFIKEEIQLQDIEFIMTVPDGCDDTVRILMIEAAEKSGIQRDQMRIILKSDAAFAYCQYNHLEKGNYFESLFKEQLIPGFKYMVIDAEGETTDISVHETVSSTSLKQVVMPSEIKWAGNTVDDAYWHFFCDLLGEENMKRFKDECIEDYLDFFRKFEVQKCSGPLINFDYVYIGIPMPLTEIVDESGGVKKTISSSKYKDIISFDDRSYKCKIPYKEFEYLFTETCENITFHLQKMWDENDLTDVQTVLLVGGFAECYILQNMIREHLELRDKHLIFPNEPSFAVLKGAVYMGHIPNARSTRLSDYSHGVQSFDSTNHSQEKMEIVLDKARSVNVFVQCQIKCEKINTGDYHSLIFDVMKPDEEKLECNVYKKGSSI